MGVVCGTVVRRTHCRIAPVFFCPLDNYDNIVSCLIGNLQEFDWFISRNVKLRKFLYCAYLKKIIDVGDILQLESRLFPCHAFYLDFDDCRCLHHVFRVLELLIGILRLYDLKCLAFFI